MRHGVFLPLWLVLATATLGQTPATPSESDPGVPRSPDTLQSTSTLVVVPTSVRTHAAVPVHTLTDHDFRLLDNGVQQTVTLDTGERQPLAIVVVLQTGGAARQQFGNYAGVATMVDSIAGSAPHRVAVVTFDSQPEEEWSFTSSVDALTDVFQHPEPGDDGAAILNAVSHGIGMLSALPPGVRRILLLISQRQDNGHAAHLQDTVRRLCEQNITIYAVTFSPQKAWLEDQFTKSRHEQPPYQLSPVGPTVLHTFDVGTPLGVALGALRTNTSAEIASLSGGESLTFANRRELEQQLATIANELPNRYTLTFQPRPLQAGFHTLQVQLPLYPDLDIAARTSYWSDPR